MEESKYCCFCGKKLVLKKLFDGTVEKYCVKCDYVFFNSPLPAVIVMITNADRVLLARGINWEHPYWGLVSGHIRVGETAEQAAIREVFEETQLKIQNPRFLKTYVTESLDFLMLAFTAETNNPSIRVSQELKYAKWFSLNRPLPLRPKSISAQIVQFAFLHSTLFSEIG